jgi:hypothetical protein
MRKNDQILAVLLAVDREAAEAVVSELGHALTLEAGWSNQ